MRATKSLILCAVLAAALAGYHVRAAPPVAAPAKPNLSGFPTKTEMQAYVAGQVAGLASQSNLTSMQTALMAAIPQPASTIPSKETVAGAAGTSTLYRRSDAVQPRITRSTTLTLDAGGTASFDWTSQGALATPVQVVLTPIYTGAGTPSCLATAVSANAVSIKCVMGNALSLTLSALTAAGVAGLTLNPWSGSTAGMQVSVVALPKS